MSVNSLKPFTEALAQCASCGSRCTATLPATDLARVVEEVVAELAPSGWGGLALPQDCPPDTLLLILTYSYACGVFGSDDIAEELETHADRCALVDQLAIDASTLARFRREHHGLLRRCLAAVLRRLDVPGGQGPSPEVRAVMEPPKPAARPSLRIYPEGEAERRIVLAAQTDSEEQDR